HCTLNMDVCRSFRKSFGLPTLPIGRLLHRLEQLAGTVCEQRICIGLQFEKDWLRIGLAKLRVTGGHASPEIHVYGGYGVRRKVCVREPGFYRGQSRWADCAECHQ